MAAEESQKTCVNELDDTATSYPLVTLQENEINDFLQGHLDSLEQEIATLAKQVRSLEHMLTPQ